MEVKPNNAHLILAEMEKYFDVTIITQNVDDLHEQGGSSKVIHLHGELFKSRSTLDPELVYDIEGWEIKLGDKCEKGSQLRPHIVWFGEMVPMMEHAVEETLTAEIFLVVGTSLQVYPAAGLLDYVEKDVPKFVVDPNMPTIIPLDNLFLIKEKATEGMEQVKKQLLENYL
ncbi:MAG: NAD-dependent deacylase [Bacteroidetes bacterium]|nr:NAD-dependent deacylase [Bacteroidota bacterium]